MRMYRAESIHDPVVKSCDAKASTMRKRSDAWVSGTEPACAVAVSHGGHQHVLGRRRTLVEN
jgi:hypothetical protein